MGLLSFLKGLCHYIIGTSVSIQYLFFHSELGISENPCIFITQTFAKLDHPQVTCTTSLIK